MREYVAAPKITHHAVVDFVDTATWQGRTLAVTRYGWLYELDPVTNGFTAIGKATLDDQAICFIQRGDSLKLLCGYGHLFEVTIEDGRFVFTLVTRAAAPEVDRDWDLTVRTPETPA